MFLSTPLLLSGLLVLPSALAAPAPSPPIDVHGPLQTQPSPYTLTAYKPGNKKYNGLRVNNLQLFKATVSQYCPSPPVTVCPNGTQMAWAGTMGVLVNVPGGQDLYVNEDGLISITVQHSHTFPPGSFPWYQGWTWTPLPVTSKKWVQDCPIGNKQYNCRSPSGYWNFKAPGATTGGIAACSNPYDKNDKVPKFLYAITPKFSRKGCVKLDGLATHEYHGPNPPVWAY